MQWHGWATIVASPGVEDDEAADRAQRRAEQAVAALVERVRSARSDNEFYDVRSHNGWYQLAFNGSHNRYPASGGPVEFARDVAGVAVGSYGILYILDEDVSYDWQRWVMRRGHLTLERDDSLSPHIGKVEDADA